MKHLCLRRCLFACLPALTLLATSHESFAANAGGVSWAPDRSVAAGSACSNVDAFVLANGTDLSISFSNLGVTLGHGSPTQGEGACTVRVPADVPVGVFPSLVRQSYQFGVTRTGGASGSLAAAIRFMGIAVSSLPIDAVASGPHQTVSRDDRFDARSPWFAKWCAPSRATSGFLQADFRARAQLASASDSIVMFVDGLGLKYDLVTTWQPCGS